MRLLKTFLQFIGFMFCWLMFFNCFIIFGLLWGMFFWFGMSGIMITLILLTPVVSAIGFVFIMVKKIITEVHKPKLRITREIYYKPIKLPKAPKRRTK